MSKLTSPLSIVEVVETLSNISDLEFDRNIGIAQKHEFVLQNEKIDYKTVNWLHQKDANLTLRSIKETFRVILHYLHQFYDKEYSYVTDQKTVDEIKTIMVLVAEAAKKIDRYAELSHYRKSVTQLKEYKQLQDFYLTRIDRKIDEGTLGKWILGLSIGKEKQERSSSLSVFFPTENLDEVQHIFIDLETVKKDSEYELFFIRKEDETRFFNSRLLRNIKLICDFETYFREHKGIDPLEGLLHWQDRILHTCSKAILKSLEGQLGQFFHEIRQVKTQEAVVLLNKALLALLLSSHSQNLLKHHPIKSCGEYFEDFQSFFKEVLKSNTYQKWLSPSFQERNYLGSRVVDIVQMICKSIYTQLEGLKEMVPIIHRLIKEASQTVPQEQIEQIEKSGKLWKVLAHDYAMMTQLMKKHPNGPLLKVLTILEENAFHVFHPLMQHNIPQKLYRLVINDQSVTNIRLPSPTSQEFIHTVSIDEEFKCWLTQNQREGSRHLLINLQDRTSWREYARCKALEKLQNQYEGTLVTVTLAVDTNFYHQLTPYHQLNQAEHFFKTFKEQLLNEESGFFFPAKLSQEVLSSFIDSAFLFIHHIFFSNKNVLPRENRLDFIEIFYLFLQLKLIEWIEPHTFSLTSKDSIDQSMIYNTELFLLLKIVVGKGLQAKDREFVNFMLYAPTLLMRERLILLDSFNRMLGALKTIENGKEEKGGELAKGMKKCFPFLFKNFSLITD
jgi:hypothetical protein